MAMVTTRLQPKPTTKILRFGCYFDIPFASKAYSLIPNCITDFWFIHMTISFGCQKNGFTMPKLMGFGACAPYSTLALSLSRCRLAWLLRITCCHFIWIGKLKAEISIKLAIHSNHSQKRLVCCVDGNETWLRHIFIVTSHLCASIS